METRRAEIGAFICATFSGGFLTLKCAAHLTLGGVAAVFARFCWRPFEAEVYRRRAGAPPVPQLKKGLNERERNENP